MKQEQLKKLAEWYWDGKNIFDLPQITDMYLPSECNDIRVELDMKNVITFDPCEDSNQLDMLMKKWIKEAKINRIEYDLLQSGWWQATYYYGVDDDERYETEGKGINACDINAILNYVEEK